MSLVASWPYTLTNGQTADANQVMANFNALNNAMIDIFNVSDYGAVGNGITGDTLAIQNAINAAAAVNGGLVYFPGNHVYLINSTLTISTSQIYLLGDGCGDNDINGNIEGQSTTIKWGGSSGGTMLTITTPAGSGNKQVKGGGVQGIYFEGQGSNLAGIGINLVGVNAGHYQDIRLAHFSNKAFYVGPTPAAISDNNGVQSAYFENVGFLQFAQAGHCFYLDGPAFSGSVNCSINTFINCHGLFHNGSFIYSNGMDNNSFFDCTSYRDVTGTGNAAYLAGGNAGNQNFATQDNYFYHWSSNAPTFVGGTTTFPGYPTLANVFINIDQGNNTPMPTIETGAQCQYISSYGQGNFNANLATNLENLITALTNVTLFSFNAPVTGLYTIYCYLRVITATTTVTLKTTTTDVAGSATYYHIAYETTNGTPIPLLTASMVVGSYTVVPLTVYCKGGSNLKIQALVGTINQVYISAVAKACS